MKKLRYRVVAQGCVINLEVQREGLEPRDPNAGARHALIR